MDDYYESTSDCDHSTTPCSTSSYDNITLPDDDHHRGSYQYWALSLLVFPAVTLFGNVLVCLSVYRERSLHTVTNYFIVSLAVADIMVALLVMPFAVYVEVNNSEWMLGDGLCDAWVAFDVMCCTASILNLTAISVDRFIAVTQPIKYAKHKNSKRAFIMLVLAWVVSIAISSPIAFGMNYTARRQHTPTVCTFYNSDFLIFSSMGSFYIPCIVMLLLYGKMFSTIRQRAHRSVLRRQGARTHVGNEGGWTKPCNAEEKVLSVSNAHVAHASIASSCSTALVALTTELFNPAATSCTTNAPPSAKSTPHSSNIAPSRVCNAPLITRDPPHSTSGNHPSTENTASSSDYNAHSSDCNAPSSDCNAPFSVNSSPHGIISPPRDVSSGASDGQRNELPRGGHVTWFTERPPAAGQMSIDDGDDAVDETEPSALEMLPIPVSLSRSYGVPSILLVNPPALPPSECVENQELKTVTKRQERLLSVTKFNFYLRRCSSKRDRSATKRERKATKTLAIVLAVFLFCWLPFFTINIINAVCIRYESCDSSQTQCSEVCHSEAWLFSFFVWLGYINSFLNPVIYTIFNIEFRRAFDKLLRHPCKL